MKQTTWPPRGQSFSLSFFSFLPDLETWNFNAHSGRLLGITEAHLLGNSARFGAESITSNSYVRAQKNVCAIINKLYNAHLARGPSSKNCASFLAQNARAVTKSPRRGNILA